MSAPARFDREASLDELLRALPRGQLPAALDCSLGPHWEMLDQDGARVLGPGLDGAPGASAATMAGAAHAAPLEAALVLGIDTLGRLRSAGPDRGRLACAVRWVQLALAGAERYRMASELHLESVYADYQALHVQHAALQQSEARYRALAAQLEQRVAAQTLAIEHAQRQFYHTEKMAAVGTLAAGMAHEINNPIGFIRSNLSSAARYVDSLAEALRAYRGGDAAAALQAWQRDDIDGLLQDFPALLAESAAGADRVAHIVQNLKAYADGSGGAGAAVPADIGAAVRAVAALVREQLPANVRFELRLEPLPMLACDPGRIQQMLLALLQNARQALPAGGGLIRLGASAGAGLIRLQVEDDGCGVAPAIAARVFDPFFTTRAVGAGMGLGLTVARDIAGAHGGAIVLDSGGGAGARVTVELPLAGMAGPA